MSGGDLGLLQTCLGRLPRKPDQKMDDIVLVALDFENTENIVSEREPAQYEAGVAICDTRALLSSSHSSHTEVISAFNFITGPPNYIVNKARRFLFGSTTIIDHTQLVINLENLVPRFRNIVLVGHAFENELRVLRHLDFDLKTSIVGVLDTARIAPQILRGTSLKLSGILDRLGCQYRNLHTAGNDAYFTLVAMLLLGTQSNLADTPQSDSIRSLTEMFSNMCFEPEEEEDEDKASRKKKKEKKHIEKKAVKLRRRHRQAMRRQERKAKKQQELEHSQRLSERRRKRKRKLEQKHEPVTVRRNAHRLCRAKTRVVGITDMCWA